MIILLCGLCGLDMMVADTEYVLIGQNHYKIIYHLQCENFHKSFVEGSVAVFNAESVEERVIKFLAEQSNKRYNNQSNDKKDISN